MPRNWRLATTTLLCIALGACGGGMVKRVSPPAASLQQITVHADGSWSADLRLQNYSSIPMRFDSLQLDISVAEQAAGTLQASPALSIGPESADVVRVSLRPSPLARLAVADALAGRHGLAYTLKGSVEATPEDRKARSFDIDSRNQLNPAPGLDGVLR